MNEFFGNLTDILSRLQALFSSYHFVIDTIDILLVTLLVYKIIKFLSESRALHVIKGIVLLLVAYFIINLLDMQASTYIFRMVMNNFIIIVIILFAPELRQLLKAWEEADFQYCVFLVLIGPMPLMLRINTLCTKSARPALI